MKKVQSHIPYPILLSRFDDILGSGLNPEVYLDGGSLEKADPSDLAEIKDGFEKMGLTITLHGPYMDLSPGSGDEKMRLATAERFHQAFRAAMYLRPGTIVLHAGYDDRRFDGDIDLWLNQSLKTWPPFIKEAEKLDMVIAVENIFEENPSTLKTLVEWFNSPYLRVCLDSGHLNIFSRVGMEEWFKEIGPLIAEVHIHDNHGEKDEHLPAGEGTVDFPLFFTLLKKYSNEPVYTVENHGEAALFRGLEAVRRFL